MTRLPFQELEANPSNYDAWFDLLRLVESEGDQETVRETYERAIANVPPTRVRKPLSVVVHAGGLVIGP